MNRHIIPTLLFALFFGSSLSLYAQTDAMGESLQKIHRLFTILESNYVDNYDSKKATEDAIKAILKELDPHSNYLDAEELKRANESLQGSFEGVGITYNNDEDTLLIVSVIEDGPADKAGICPGDRVMFVGDSLIAGININAARLSNLLRGKKGSEVVLRVLREDQPDTLTFKVKRDKIAIESVSSAYMVTDRVGYIKVLRFGAQTASELNDAIKKLKKQGMENLILDLRGNPGGYLHAAVEMCDELLPKNDLIVYTQGKESKRKDFYTKPGGIFETGKLAVLIDENSASASEIVSGAVQDLDRGLVIGRRSFGKGLVQNTYTFADGSAARITTARYYTPSGRCIQRPYTGGKDKYYEELKKRYERGELSSADSIVFPDSLKFKTKTGRIVYAAGGIMPDIFVPLDSLFTDSVVKVMNDKNLLYRFGVRFVQQNRKKLLKEYSSFESFRKNYHVDAATLEQFGLFCVEKGTDIKPTALNQDVRNYAEIMLKANIARIIWNTNEYTAILNERDPVMKAALLAFEKDKMAELLNSGKEDVGVK